MVELFGIREPLDGRFPKDSLRAPFHTGPRKCRTHFEPDSIWPECFRFFKQILPARAGKAFTASFLKPKPSVCSRPGIRAATRNPHIPRHENSFPTSSAPFGHSPP